jgi:hypothetical protein
MADSQQRPGPGRAGRWAIALAAVVVLVVAFVVLRGGSSDEPAGQASQTTPAPAQQTHTRTQDQQQTQDPQQTQAPATPAVATIRVRGGAPVGGVQKLEFRKGDVIRFQVVADAPDEAHFHGYDIEKAVGPGIRARFVAKATIEGRFEVELHHAGAQLARVDVVP